MNSAPAPPARCGIDTVEIARVEKMIQGKTTEELRRLFAEEELREAGNGPARPNWRGRFAAKEACCKLFPRETALGIIQPADFAIRRDAYGAPCVEPGPNAQVVLDRSYVAGLCVSLTHTDTSASAIALAEPKRTEVPWFGKALYYLFPLRRGVVLGNLRRVFGDVLPESEIRRLAQACYAHFARFLIELLRLPLTSAKKRESWIRVENTEAPIRAHQQGKDCFCSRVISGTGRLPLSPRSPSFTVSRPVPFRASSFQAALGE
jgi:holo-[acyl-carrier-protein] synthase